MALGGLALVAVASPAGCARDKPCNFNSDCVQSYCADGTCKQDCVDSEVDCPKGQHCNVIAKCEDDDPTGGTTGSGGSSSTTSASGGGEGGTITTSTTTTTSATTTSTTSSGPGGGNPGKPQLTLCNGDQECAQGLICRPLVRNGTKRCTEICNGNGDCPPGMPCLDDGSGTKICAGIDTGRTCAAAATCNFGCLLGPKYCTNPCFDGSDCPNGYGCMAVGGSQVCVKVEAPCTPQMASACIVPAACDTSSPTLAVWGCTLACNSAADCPRRAQGLLPWTCNGGLCQRPSDVYGPLPGGDPAEYACNENSQPTTLCNDAQHIDFNAFNIPPVPFVDCNSPNATPGVPGDSCVDSCRYQGGCRFGFACVAVGGVGQSRIGLCLPSGAGEIGAQCTIDAQCSYAYCVNGKCSRDCTADGLCPGGGSCVATGGPTVEGMTFKRCQ